MNYLHLLYSLCLTYVICAPTEKTFYAALVEKCPLVSTSTEKDLALFQTCNDWKTISAVNNLTPKNEKDILCLLYFESFTHYCTSTEKPDISIPQNVQLNNDLNTICNFTKNLQHKNLSKIFSVEQNCKDICTDEFGLVEPVCSISYYFANMKKDSGNNESPHEQNLALEQDLKNKNQGVPPASVPENKPQNGAITGPESQPQTNQKKLKIQSAPTDNVVSGDGKVANEVKETESKAVKKVQRKPQETVQDTQSNFNPPHPDPPAVDNNAVGVETPEVQAVQTENTGSVQTADNVSDKNKVNLLSEQKNHLQVENNPGGVEAPIEANNQQVLQKLGAETDLLKEKVDSVDAAKLKPIKGKANEVDPGTNQAPVSDNQDKKKIVQDNVIDEQQMEEKTPEDFDAMDVGPEDDDPEPSLNVDQNEKPSKPSDTEPANYNSEMDGDSYFFTYFMLLCIVFIVGYVCYHNKQKILALILEGRRGKRQYRGRRPNSANYHKLDSNLEEAINSSCKKNPNNVIY